MQFTRRQFAKTAALGLVYAQIEPARGAVLVNLHALFAEQVPSCIQVPAYVLGATACVFERRVYHSAVPLDVFAKHGIVLPLREGATYLFRFASLEARARAWDRLSADPSWKPMGLSEISLYRL